MIIGIHGKIHAGKTTAMEVFQKYGGRELRFADKLKAMVASLLSVPVELMENPDFKSRPIPWLLPHTPRTLLQTLGTEWGRGLDENIWVKATMASASELGGMGYELIVITDVRFPNEMKYIQQIGGKVIKIVRPAIDRSGPEHQHPSETALDDIPDFEFDSVIWNEGTAKQFRSKIEDFITKQLQL